MRVSIVVKISYLLFCVGGGQQGQEREVYLEMKHGVEAKNYEDVIRLSYYLNYLYSKMILVIINIFLLKFK